MVDSKVKMVSGLSPLVSGGDGSHSHVLVLKDNGFMLIPRLNENRLKVFFFYLAMILLLMAVYLIVQWEIFDAIFVGLFAFCFYLFGKEGKLPGPVSFDLVSNQIFLHETENEPKIKFVDIKHVELIHKLKSAGNNYIVKTNELNLELKNGSRVNIATGGDLDVIWEQAELISKTTDAYILHDNEEKYR